MLRDAGRPAEAEQCYAGALRARPHYFKAAMSVANMQLQQGNKVAAEASFRRAIEIDPKHAEAHYWLGSLLQSQERLDEAADALQAAILRRPHYYEAQNNLGCVFRSQGKLDQAEQCLRLAIVEKPDSPESLTNLASVLHDRKQYDEAADCCRRALAIDPNFVQAHNNLGAVYQDQKQFDEALVHYRRALELNPKSPEALANLGATLQMQGNFEEAIGYHRRALEQDPNHHRAHYSMAAAFHAQHRFDEALASYAEAIRIRPEFAEAHYNRSFVWLTRGEFAQGWRDYDWRFKCKDYKGRKFEAPRWDGSPLEGRTLLVHAEQGLGDTLHFIRYAPLAARQGGQVYVEVQPALVPLLKSSGFAGIIPGGSPLPRFDVHASLLSLPGVLGTTLETIPATVPYLAPDPKLLKAWRGRLDAIRGFKVGIVWQGNTAYTFDHLRSIPLAELAPLAEVEGVRLVSLQKNAGAEQLSALEGQFTVVDLGSTLDTDAGAFMDTAAVMCNLDLVITSDTAAAHLAGALGVPVWVALSAAPEWRWMHDRDDSPWYPTMRLFRQPALGDWPAVFAGMKDALVKLARQRNRAP
jgi:tetratricopeptide (TPR) repeat protein